MALSAGDSDAASGMSKEIYDKLNAALSPKVPPADLPNAQKGWKELAFAIASGVIAHLLSNLEIRGLSVSGNVTLAVAGNSASGNAALNQSGATQGLIR